MIKLSINANKIALIRNSRAGNYPDLLAYARRCIELGADGITVHPRPDQRHIRASDIPELAALLKEFPSVEFNIEGNPFAGAKGTYPGYMSLIETARPAQCTLVPDSDSQLTSDHGFDLRRNAERLRPIIQQLQTFGCRVSLFMDPDCAQIDLAKTSGADAIELYTGPYAQAHCAGDSTEIHLQLTLLSAAAAHADILGLRVNAGHDLNRHNLPALVKALPNLTEVSIGHAFTVDSLESGIASTMAAYKKALSHHSS